jgi:uncharacterized protein (TIGR02391 family)
MTTVSRRPMLSANTLEAIAKSIGDSGNGLTGTEIGKILGDSKIPDTDPGLSKAKRLYNAFVNWQNANQCSNHILQFIQLALDPVRYVGQENVFQFRRNEINKRLAFIGVELGENGKYRNVEKATTISEAEQRASHFKYKLESRNIHATIMQYCTAELLVENYFHSVFEAIKSVADRIRQMTGVHADGNALVETAFSTSAPLIRINVFVTDTDRSEHLGLANLIKGIFGLIRNPTAHEPKIKFPIDEEMALDIMTTISYIHKRLDKVL